MKGEHSSLSAAPIRAVIADDEELSREVIRAALSGESDVVVAGEATDVTSTVSMVLELLPELLFLDVQMPGGSGFDVVEQLIPHYVPIVVFVTAFERYAIRAFDVHAIDYLLKPFTRKRFSDALRTARLHLRSRNQADARRKLLRMLSERRQVMKFAEATAVAHRREERIAVRHLGRVKLIQMDEIEWIEASSNYVTLHVGSHEFTVRASMPEILERLGTDRFVRIHRSTIVNILKIVEFRSKGHGDYDVVLRSGAVVTFSRSQRHALFK